MSNARKLRRPGDAGTGLPGTPAAEFTEAILAVRRLNAAAAGHSIAVWGIAQEVAADPELAAAVIAALAYQRAAETREATA